MSSIAAQPVIGFIGLGDQGLAVATSKLIDVLKLGSVSSNALTQLNGMVIDLTTSPQPWERPTVWTLTRS